MTSKSLPVENSLDFDFKKDQLEKINKNEEYDVGIFKSWDYNKILEAMGKLDKVKVRIFELPIFELKKLLVKFINCNVKYNEFLSFIY